MTRGNKFNTTQCNKTTMQTIMKGLWKTSGWLVMAAALTFGIASCSSDNDAVAEQQSVKPTGKYTMTVQVTKGDADTRALKLGTDEKSVDAYWAQGEIVEVYQNQNGETLLGTLTAAASDGITTTLTGTLEVAPSAGEALYFYLHARDRSGRYTRQNGTLASIAENQDFAEGVVQPYDATDNPNGFTIHGTQVNVPSLTLESKQAIVKFTLLDAATDEALYVTSLTVTDEALNLSSQDENPSFISGAPLTITPASPASSTDKFYVAISNLNKADKHSNLVLTATGADGYTYTYTRKYSEEAPVYFTHGMYYTRTVKMKRIFTTFSSDDVIRVGDQVALNKTWSVTNANFYINSDRTYTLIRANISEESLSGVTPDENGAYYVLQNKDSELDYVFYDKSMPVGKTSDGLVVKNVNTSGTMPTCIIGVHGYCEVWNWKSGVGLPPDGDFAYSPNNGVTLSGKNARMHFYEGLVDLEPGGPNVVGPNGLDASNTSFTFEAPSGKKFVGIKMIFKEEGGASSAHFDSNGWVRSDNTWTYNPSNPFTTEVTIEPIEHSNGNRLLAIQRIESIVFTLADDPNNN